MKWVVSYDIGADALFQSEVTDDVAERLRAIDARLPPIIRKTILNRPNGRYEFRPLPRSL